MKNYLHHLKLIASIRIDLVMSLSVTQGSILNTAIIKPEFDTIFKKVIPSYRDYFFTTLDTKKIEIERLKQAIDEDYLQRKLSVPEYNSLSFEIDVRLKKLFFLKETFDIEMSKYENTHRHPVGDIEYDTYNQAFFGITKLPPLPNTKEVYLNIPMVKYKSVKTSDLQKCIKYSSQLLPGLEFIFHNRSSSYFDEGDGNIYIKQQEQYSIQSLITIFFHEMTHFFRYKNGLNNLGFNYSFSDASTLEEGIALYNEYRYGNKICSYGEYTPYYNLCLQVLQTTDSQETKKEAIFTILKHKGFSREKSLGYYYRFYRFCPVGGQQVFMKDAIYYNGIQNVVRLLDEDSENYNLIMSGKIGLHEIDNGLYSMGKNEDSELYFDKMYQFIIQNIL